jgi:excisionase family DNA binding protein
LTIKQAAALIDGISEYRIRQMCIHGELPCVMAGKKYLINQYDLFAVLCKQLTFDDCE